MGEWFDALMADTFPDLSDKIRMSLAADLERPSTR
jgi:hypothetical protein